MRVRNWAYEFIDGHGKMLLKNMFIHWARILSAHTKR